METSVEAQMLAKMRAPFPANQISKLPKETRAQIDARKNDKRLMVFNCPQCGGHHHKDAVHLDYVGHAALTDRLLDVDPFWSWEPVAFNAHGLPCFDAIGGLWIWLIVCGHRKLGYGSADGKTGGDAVKEVIGDALRNAAMRFGAALDLWHKGDLHLDDDAESEPAPKQQKSLPQQLITPEQLQQLNELIDQVGGDKAKTCAHYKIKSLNLMNTGMYAEIMHSLNKKLKELGNEQ